MRSTARLKVIERFDNQNPGRVVKKFNKKSSFIEWYLRNNKNSNFSLREYKEAKKEKHDLMPYLETDEFYELERKIVDEIMDYLDTI